MVSYSCRASGDGMLWAQKKVDRLGLGYPKRIRLEKQNKTRKIYTGQLGQRDNTKNAWQVKASFPPETGEKMNKFGIKQK